MSNQRGRLKAGLIKDLTKEQYILWRSDKTKERDCALLEVANCGRVNIWGKLMEGKS